MGEQHNPGALVAQVRDGGKRGLDAGLVRHAAVLQRHIEIHADQRALAIQGLGGQVPQAALAHLPAM